MRPFDEQEPNAEALRELAAVDSALAGRPAPPDLVELEELTIALRTERSVPEQRFAARLDALVESGFAPDFASELGSTGASASRAPGVPGALRRLVRDRRRSLPLALASATSVLVVAVALVSSGSLSGGDERTTTTPAVVPAAADSAGGSASAREAAPSPKTGVPAPASGAGAATGDLAQGSDRASAPSVSPPSPGGPPGGSGIAPRRQARKVERQASLTLAASPSQVEEVADRVVSVTDRYRGIVVSSTVSGGERDGAGAMLDLRIPSGRLQPALADLSELAHVRSRTQATQDVTARYVSLRGSLRVELAEREALLRQLARASTANETASIRARLRLVDRKLGRLRARLRSQSDRVDYAAVAVTLEADGSQSAGGGHWTVSDALEDALSVLGTMLGVAVVALAVVLPLGALALLLGLGGRAFARARRERALDSAPN